MFLYRKTSYRKEPGASMNELALLGDEAVALGAIHAGLTAAYGYPGTPSTEILEYLISRAEEGKRPPASWCANEKTAYEEALGVSYVGRRALVTMKHVGLNVAADPFVNSALLDIRGGLVLAVADDPGMHSSQNEQDSRFYADYAKIICLEPVSQQEAYDMTREAFDLSEIHHIPVMLRLTTRLAHSRAGVTVSAPRAENALLPRVESAGWALLPAYARKRYDLLLSRQKDFREYSENTDHNPLYINAGFKDFGVITTGLGKNYYEENLPELGVRPSHLHIGVYPLPGEKIRRLAGAVKKIIVVEEGMPFAETALRGILPLPVPVAGKLNGTLPEAGELNPDILRPALGLPTKPRLAVEVPELPARPPQLCAGCPHGDTYTAIKKALQDLENSVITSDIGCYALGALPPFSMPETIVCMGASVGMAKGAAEAGVKYAVAVIGDSTFLHSGITPLIDAVSRRTPMTLIILDNSVVAMTGGQTTILPSTSLETLVKGLGVEPEHVVVLEAHRRLDAENTAAIRREIEYPGVSVVIAVRECIESARVKKKAKEAAR
jgi:indolepyruvate ferredoxin oxidoreductase alpha subunit